jgi:hypothetical protein
MSPKETKRTDRQRWAVECGDRELMLDIACQTVQMLGDFMRPATVEGIRGGSEPLEGEERRAYDAALRMLAREFDAGPVESTSHVVESDVSLEVVHDDAVRDEAAGESSSSRPGASCVADAARRSRSVDPSA